MLKVSIIIPVYNVEKYLEESIGTVINQTLRDIEIICIDDCSTDASLQILENLQKNDNRIKILKLEKNSGAAVARNLGLQIATGEFVGFMDPDDKLDLNYFEELYKKAKETNSLVVKCNRITHNTDGTIVKSTLNDKIKNNIFEFGYEWTTAIYNREFLSKNNISFPNECIKAQDIVFLNRVLLNLDKIELIDNVYYNYYRREDSLNSKYIPEKYFLSALLAIRIITKEINQSNLDNKDPETYIKYYNSRISSLFLTLFQTKSYKLKYKCIKTFIEVFNDCKDPTALSNVFYYKWMLPYIKTNNPILLATIICLSCKNKTSLINKPKSIAQFIFSITNENTRKVITIFGIKLKFKNRKRIQQEHIKQLELKISNLNNKIQTQQELLNRYQKQLESDLKKSKRSYNNKINSEKKNLIYKIHKYLPQEKYKEALVEWFFERTGEVLNLENPQTFNEKIQWLKLYDSTPEKTLLADKYLVRDWVKEKIGEEYLIPLLGVWDNFDDIDFDTLPEQFVLKCNHGCAYNIVVKNKSQFDKEDARKKINTWLNEDYAFKYGFELHYTNIPRKIIAEKYIENNNEDLYDYKFWCFDGKVEYIQFLSERNTNGLKMAFYDRYWNKQTFYNNNQYNPKDIEKPKNLEQLIKLSEELSKGITYVRVDFYLLDDGSIKFGEMTFTPTSGSCKWDSKETNIMLGQLLKLPERNKS